MKLLDHFARSGDVLFRWRGQLPLLLLPAFLLAVLGGGQLAGRAPVPRAWEVFSALVALAGLAIRVVAIGTAPEGTSERSTTNPRASMLRTTGLYSLVRHPLYLGNSLTATGLACFTGAWYLPVIVVLAATLYHERICAREEAFLEDKFGSEFRAWAERVPAAIPRLSTYVPSAAPFRWRRVLGREFHGLMAIASSVFVLDVARSAVATGHLVFDPLWTGFFLAATAVFVVCSVLKKTTSVFKMDEDSRQSHSTVDSQGSTVDDRP